MPNEIGYKVQNKYYEERVSTVLDRAKKLSSELSSTVAELANLLQSYDKEEPSGL